MGIGFFRSNKNQDNFSRSDPDDQFRPRISKGDFYSNKGFDFGWMLLEPIEDLKSELSESKITRRLSKGQKSLYFWWYLDGQVTNGGFVQFYYNGYDMYMPAIISGLEFIGDTKMATIAKSAHDVYLKRKSEFNKAKRKDLFGTDIYQQFDDLAAFDDEYYNLNDSTMAIIENYARSNPNEFCVDENGNEFAINESVTNKTYHKNGMAKEEFTIVNGVLNDEYKTYNENGKIISLENFVNGEKIGLQKRFDESGNIVRIIDIDPSTKNKRVENFYPNGQPSKLEFLDSKDRKVGEYKEWYENGQLKEHATNIGQENRNGIRLEYWENGSVKLDVEFKEGIGYFKNCWDQNGIQTMKDGTGLCVNEWGTPPFEYIEITEYANYKKHGKSIVETKGLSYLESNYVNGTLHGVMRRYDKNRNLVEENIYENGEVVSTKNF